MFESCRAHPRFRTRRRDRELPSRLLSVMIASENERAWRVAHDDSPARGN
jgi:hypothetical protein